MTTTTRDLERAAVAAHRRGIGWLAFWEQHGPAVCRAEPYDRERFALLGPPAVGSCGQRQHGRRRGPARPEPRGNRRQVDGQQQHEITPRRGRENTIRNKEKSNVRKINHSAVAEHLLNGEPIRAPYRETLQNYRRTCPGK